MNSKSGHKFVFEDSKIALDTVSVHSDFSVLPQHAAWTQQSDAFYAPQTYSSAFSDHEDFGLQTASRHVDPTTAIGTTGVFQNQDVNGLLSGVAWDTRVLTYSFPAKASFYGSGYSDSNAKAGFEALDDAHQAVVRYALSLIAQYTGLQFNEITETKNTHATLRFSGSSYPPTSYAYYPGNYDSAGDAWYGNIRDAFPEKAGYEFDTILHEIGHTMGLKHGQQEAGTKPAYGVLPADHDSTEWSLMDYHSSIGADLFYRNVAGSGNQTYMTDDISALQYMYGANFHTHSGDTVYTWNAATGEMSIDGVGQGAATTNTIYEALWDGNGKDTYDLSNYTTNMTIDLQPGEWSTFSTNQLAYINNSDLTIRPPGNVANANMFENDPRSLIENANGGSGDDTITGNRADNTLTGNGGDDILLPETGKDIAKGGTGDDTISFEGGRMVAGDRLDGGSGADTLILDGTYVGDKKLVFQAATLTNVETIKLGDGHNYAITTANGTVASGKTLTVDASHLTGGHTLKFDGSAETNGHFVLMSGKGADTFTGGAQSDTFAYAAASQSKGTAYDTAIGVDFGSDKFDITGKITGVGTATGKLSAATFDTNLTADLTTALAAKHALLFTASSGSLSGETFLVIDQNGHAGYQAGNDLVIHLSGQTGVLSTGDFV